MSGECGVGNGEWGVRSGECGVGNEKSGRGQMVFLVNTDISLIVACSPGVSNHSHYT